MSQLSEIVAKVQRRIRDSNYSSSEITDYINDTQNDVFNEYRLPFMEAQQTYTLTPGVSDITNGSGLPANYVQAINVILSSGGVESNLIQRDIRYIDNVYPDSQDTTLYPPNIPTQWYKFANTIRVHSAPSSAFGVTLQYYKKPTILEADSDVPEIPTEFEELLVTGAAYRVLQVKDNYDQAGILQNKYEEILDKLVSKYSQTQVGRATLMRINRRGVGKANY